MNQQPPELKANGQQCRQVQKRLGVLHLSFPRKPLYLEAGCVSSSHTGARGTRILIQYHRESFRLLLAQEAEVSSLCRQVAWEDYNQLATQLQANPCNSMWEPCS